MQSPIDDVNNSMQRESSRKSTAVNGTVKIHSHTKKIILSHNGTKILGTTPTGIMLFIK